MSSPLSTARPGRQEASFDEARPLLHPDRLFPIEPEARRIARHLYESVRDLPILSPHGHTDPRWFAQNEAFPDPATLFVKPDHYVYPHALQPGRAARRRSASRAATAAGRGRSARRSGGASPSTITSSAARRRALGSTMRSRRFSSFDERLCAENADALFTTRSRGACHAANSGRARSSSASRSRRSRRRKARSTISRWHKMIRESGWNGRVVTAYRPDPVVDPGIRRLRRQPRALRRDRGRGCRKLRRAISTPIASAAPFSRHGRDLDRSRPPEARTADLARTEAQALYAKVRGGKASAADAELFRAQMLTEMAAMSHDDGLVMQLHPGSLRNHNPLLHAGFGRDIGADIPTATDYVARAQAPA